MTSSTLATNPQWDPATYDARAPFVSALGADLVGWLDPRPEERILDLGCGSGELAAVIAGRGARVTCLDASPEMVAAARTRVPSAEHRVADGQALDYQGAFEAVFSNAALHWMLRAEDTARGIAQALRPGGRLVAEFGGRGCVATVRAGVIDALRSMGEDPTPWLSWYFPGLGEYTSLLEGVGLEPREARLFERPTAVPGADGLAAWLGIFLERLRRYLGERWRELVGRVEDHCRPALRTEDGWTLDYVRLRVLAHKGC